MPWKIKQPDGTTILDSSKEFGLYLIDVKRELYGDPTALDSWTFPPDKKNSSISYDYSNEADEIYPVLVPIITYGGGWGPALENWSGPTDTTFSVAAREDTTVGDRSYGDIGYHLYVFASKIKPTSAKPTITWSRDDGSKDVIGNNGAPLRFISKVAESTDSDYKGCNITPPSDPGGLDVFGDYRAGVIKPGIGDGNGVFCVPGGLPGCFVTSTLNPDGWSMQGKTTNGQEDVWWFSTKWPKTTNTGTPYMKLKENTSDNRTFFDSRENYLRVLDIQYNTSAPTGTQFSSFDLVSFDTGKVPDDDSWGVISSFGARRLGAIPDAPGSTFWKKSSSDSRTLRGAGPIRGYVIAIAVDLTGL